jgi:1-acyl-sn-glycerol-3-phosphate acyltransferase
MQITTEWRHLERVPPSGFHVAVSNHTCVGDFLLLYRQPTRYTHLIHAAVPTRGKDSATQERGGRHRVRFMQATPAAFKSLRRAAEAAADAPDDAGSNLRPVHLFPEGGMTSGAGVMRFSRGFALLRAPVVPIALRCSHALGISSHTLTSSFAANLFWLSFAPWTRMSATVLPVMHPVSNESDEAFAERVRSAIAAELGVPMLEVGIKEKYALKEACRAAPGARAPEAR